MPTLTWMKALPTMPSVCTAQTESERTSGRTSSRKRMRTRNGSDGRAGNANLDDLPCLEPGHPDASAHLQAGHLAERGVELELRGEEQSTVADEKQAPAEQEQPSKDERSHERAAKSVHWTMPPRDELLGSPAPSQPPRTS